MIAQNKTIDSKFVLAFFLCTFPILPSYFNLAGIAGVVFFPIVFLFLIVVHTKGKLPVPKIQLTPLALALGAWIAGQGISSITHGKITASITLLFTTVFVWYGLFVLIKSRDSFLHAIKSVIMTGGVVSVLGLIESFTGFNIFSLLNTTGAQLNYNPRRFGIIRIISFSSHAIVYGLFLAFVMALALYYLQFCRSSKERAVTFVAYCLMWSNLLLTLSRSSILCTILSQLLILVFSGMKKALIIIARILGIIIVSSLLLRLFYPSIFESVVDIGYMILALFDDRYQSAIALSFGNDNLGGVGNRIDLYQWVFDKMSDHWLFGFGIDNTFSHRYRATDGMFVWHNTKTSLEVQYLNTLYYYGLITVIPEILVYIELLKATFVRRRKAAWEKTISFNAISFSVFVSYFLALFAVNRSSEYKMFYVLIGLILVYNSQNRFEKEINNYA